MGTFWGFLQTRLPGRTQTKVALCPPPSAGQGLAPAPPWGLASRSWRQRPAIKTRHDMSYTAGPRKPAKNEKNGLGIYKLNYLALQKLAPRPAHYIYKAK